MNARGRTQFAPTEKDREHKNPLSFFTRLAPQGIVGYTFSVLSGGNIAFLREEGGTRQGFPEANEMSFGGSLRSVTEGARVTLVFNKFYRNALSLTRLRRELPPGGSLWVVSPKVHLLFLTSTSFVDTKSKPRTRRGKNNLFSMLI